jgi:hypothetical protein
MAGRPLKNFPAHFWSRSTREPDDGCWLWTGCLNPRTGYGRITSAHTREVYTHRVAWELTNGPIPAGYEVCHHCDVRACCRPDHLFLGSRLDNMQDAARKGRTVRGEQKAGARFTEDDIRAIRARWEAGGITKTQIARYYGTRSGVICNIINRRTWAWLSSESGTS